MNKIILCVSLVALLSCSQKSEINSVQTISVPSQSVSGEPFLFTDSDGNVFLSWVEVSAGVNTFKFSTLKDNGWSDPTVIASGKNWFVNWADYPMLAVRGKEMIAHYLGKSGEGKFAYDVMTTYSHDAGKSWTTPNSIHDDGLEAEHGFVSLLPLENNFLVFWLDGRNTVMEGGEDHEGHHGQMSLRGAVVDLNGNKLSEWELDNRTCDCCQTTAVNTASGPVVVYRDRSEEEIRDIYITRLVKGEWTAPKSIYNDNWKITGCPVNGPRADAIENNLVIAWYSVPKDSTEVKLIFSKDGGDSFSQPIRIDEGKAIGRVDVVMLDQHTAMVNWMEGADIKVREVKDDGTLGKPITVASTSESRSSGFPQMTKSGNKIVFAWTDDKEKVIKSAVREL